MDNKKKIWFMVLGVILVIILIIVIIVIGKKEEENKGIDIKVTTSNNLQISVDGLNWYSEIDREMLSQVSSSYSNVLNQLPDTLGNMSTAGYVNNGKLDMYYQNINDDGITAIKEDEMHCIGNGECKESHFIAFDIFLLAKEPLSIGLSNNSRVTVMDKVKDLGVQNATRVGLVLEGTVASDKYIDAQNLKGGYNSYIWEPNADVHNKEAQIFVRENYDIEISLENEDYISYKGVGTPFNDKIALKNVKDSICFSDINHLISTSKNFKDSQKIFDISSGITKIRIYLWMEGQDFDSLNKTEVSNLQFNLDLVVME